MACLLPAGVRAVEGAFGRGDPIAVRDPAGREVARGLAAYDAEDARREAALARPGYIKDVLMDGSKKAQAVASHTMERVREAVKLKY